MKLTLLQSERARKSPTGRDRGNVVGNGGAARSRLRGAYRASESGTTALHPAPTFGNMEELTRRISAVGHQRA